MPTPFAKSDTVPYDDLEVEKRERVNHVAKRLGTALRKTVKNKRKAKIAIGGNGLGKLMQVKIGKLQKYYTRAIRSSDSVDGMRKSIWASYKHCASTNQHSQHEDCP
ncbi:hypothetical protein ElyMa_006827100 [Elysia marginata]|uniref:Mutator-like transposase domain-containing protein n=1 Tax=Elysia marginata TaxID=1093978 RepID=A0AAV4J5L7_9GAST|nr:hypothetical protein ElyMa_006827100 [Elysia marginata]